MIRTDVLRRTGSLAYLELDRSRDNPSHIFLSAPPLSELTREQVGQLITALTTLGTEMWGSVD